MANQRRTYWRRGLFVFLTGYLFLTSFFVSAQTTLVYTADDYHYRTGVELLDKEKYAAAQKEFQQYIDLNRNDLKTVDARYYVAYSALNLENTNAEPLFERFIADYPEHPKAVLAYYDLGNFYFARKDYKKAISFFEKAETNRLSKEQRIEAQFKQGYAYFSQQKFEEAGKLFNELKGSQHKYTGAASYYAGYIAFRDGKYDEAIADLRKAAQSDEFRPLVPYMIASVYYKQQKYDELIAYANEIKNDKNVRSSDEVALLVGEAYFRKGDYPKANEYFQQYIEGSRTRPQVDVLYRVAFSQYKTSDYAGAVDNFKPVAAATRDTLSQYGAYYLGISYLQTNNKPFALNAFNDAKNAKYNPAIQEEAAFQHAKLQYDLGNNTEAVLALKDFLKNYPSSKHQTEANELLSETYLNSNNYAEALAHLESLKQRSPRINAAYQRVTFNRGVELFNGSKFKEAIPFFEKSLQASTNPGLTTAAHFWMGEAYSAERQYPQAIAQYNPVLTAAKTTDGINYQHKARYGIGYAYYNTQQYGQAQTHFKEYITQKSPSEEKRNYDDALLRLADTYYVGKNYTEALRLYDQAIAQNNPERDYAYFQKGAIYSITDRPEEASKSFNTVLSQFGSSRYADNAIFQKAELDLDNGAYNEAITGYSRLIGRESSRSIVPYALMKRALAYSNQQNYNKAIADYQTILDQHPTHRTATDAILGLQEALANAGRTEEFSNYLTKYKQSNPENTAVESLEFEAAKDLYFNEKYDKAIQSFENYIRQYPNTSLSYDARYYLGESYFRQNKPNEAMHYYQMVVSEGKSQFVNRAVTRLADADLAAKKYESAVVNYRRIATQTSNRKDQFNAWAGLMEAYYELDEYDSSQYFADQIVANGNASPGAQNKALLYRGKVFYAQEKYGEAVDEFLKTLNSARDENGAEAQYLIGESFYKQKQYKQSVDALLDLNKNFAAYENWRGRGFLLIADNYAAMGEKRQAEATLKSIIEYSPDEKIVAEAKKKLQELESQPNEAESEPEPVDTLENGGESDEK